MPAPLESLLTVQGPILGLALLRAGGLTLALPWIGHLPVRARIGLAIILGVALSGFSNTTTVVWSIGGAVSELLTGLSLGIGLRVITSALTAAGTWIDEQTNTGLTSEPLLEEADDTGSGTAKILTWLGAWFILTAAPGGGDLAVIERGFQSLTQIPLGSVISPHNFPSGSWGCCASAANWLWGWQSPSVWSLPWCKAVCHCWDAGWELVSLPRCLR